MCDNQPCASVSQDDDYQTSSECPTNRHATLTLSLSHTLSLSSDLYLSSGLYLSFHVYPPSLSLQFSLSIGALMEKARSTADDMRNVDLTPSEQVWSRQLYYMLGLSRSGEVHRRLQNVSEGEGAEAWKAFSEHYEPKTATR